MLVTDSQSLRRTLSELFWEFFFINACRFESYERAGKERCIEAGKAHVQLIGDRK